MSRLPDWRARLHDYLAVVARARFRPGRHDCVTLACGARAAITGEDLLEGHRGKWKSVAGGIRLARSGGFADHVAFATQELEPVPVAMARAGDLAALDGIDGIPALGVVGGAHIYTVSVRGWAVVPLLEARAAWRT